VLLQPQHALWLKKKTLFLHGGGVIIFSTARSHKRSRSCWQLWTKLNITCQRKNTPSNIYDTCEYSKNSIGLVIFTISIGYATLLAFRHI